MTEIPTKSVKLLITSNGHAELTHPSAARGYKGNCPVVEIVDVPWDMQPDVVQRTFSRLVIVKPLMFCDRPISWTKIDGATEGQIVTLD